MYKIYLVTYIQNGLGLVLIMLLGRYISGWFDIQVGGGGRIGGGG